MRKIAQKSVAVFIAVIMILAMFPATAFAAGEFTATVTSNGGMAGTSVSVKVIISDNPGITSLGLTVSYDDILTLTGVSYNTDMGGQFYEPGNLNGPVKLTWIDPLNKTGNFFNGTFATLTFTVKENAKVDSVADISLSYDPEDVYDQTETNVPLETVNGSIVVVPCVPGDINGDTYVNNKDLTRLCQYLAHWDVEVNEAALDTNGDGLVNNKDATRLAQFNAKWDVQVYCGNFKPHTHDLKAVPAKAASCTEDGNIEFWYCAGCEKCFTDRTGRTEIPFDDTVIEAKGHTVVVDEAVPATYEHTGLTEGSHCSVCNEILVKQEEYGPLAPNTRAITYNIVNEAEHPYLATLNIDTSSLKYSYIPGQALTLENLDLGKYGYTFDGWFDGFGNNATQIKEISATSNRDITVYAHVTEKVYDITYNMYQTPVTSTPSYEQLHYTVSKGNSNLYNPEINNYKFLGWYDSNNVEYKKIPIGTTGNITLNAYYTSLRNLAVSVNDDNPLIFEDQNNNAVYFTYEIGEIRNIPLNGDDPFWEIQSVAGLSQKVSDTYTTSISTVEADTISKLISDMTVNSSTWTLSENWNDVTTVNESWAEQIGKTTSQSKTDATTSSNTLSITDQAGGSSYHKNEDGSTVYDYNSKTETKDKGHQFDASLSGTYANKMSANLGASTEFGTEASYQSDNAYTREGKVLADNWSASGSSSGSSSGSAKASDKDKYSSGISYENGFEVNAGLKYGYHNNTNTVTKTGTDKVTTSSNIDENTSTWNNSATFSSTQQHSSSQTISNTLSDIVTTTKGYGSSYSKGGTDTSSQGFSSTASNTSGTTSSVTYSKLKSKTTTTEYKVDGKIEGKYRCILVGKAHVFAVVGYDYATKSFFTYTFSVMDDKVEEFLDYTPKGEDFHDCEYSCLPFEVPYFVFEYVNEKTVKTSGVQYVTNSINGTAKITGYSGSETDVIVPSYVSDGKQAYKVTEISANAFAEKSVRSVVLGDYIKSIPDGAFKNCATLEEVIGNFTEIGDEAFSGCEKLTNMNIPSNVVKLGTDAFVGVNSINVRAINSLSAYAEAVRSLPEGSSDKQIENKKRELTQEFINSVLACGANNIVLDLSCISEDVLLKIEVPEINSIEINGGTRTYKNFSLDSNAKETAINEMTISNSRGIPMTVKSDKLTLHKVFVDSNTTSLILQKDGAVLSLDQDSRIQTSSKYAVISKNAVIESLVSKDGATGFLNVYGNFGYVDSISGRDYVDISSGEFNKISQAEFEKYCMGSFTVTFDANGGNCDTESKEFYVGSEIGDLPVASRDYYGFDGWFTEKYGGEKVTSQTVFDAVNVITLYAHWTVNSYTASWSNGTGYTISVNRTSSPNKGAATGALSSGSAVYYGDVLSVTYTASTGYSISTEGKTSITVTGNVTSSDIYATASLNEYTYNVVYVSSNGTNLGGTTVTKTYGTTNMITPPEKSGYSTPAAKSVVWDSIDAKEIRFEYKPIGTSSVSRSEKYRTSPDLTYYVTLNYQNRTADSVQVRIEWSDTMQNGWTGYVYGSNLKATIAGNAYYATAVQPGGWKASGAARTQYANTEWVTVSLNTTNQTTVSVPVYIYPINYNWADMAAYDGLPSASFTLTVTITAY